MDKQELNKRLAKLLPPARPQTYQGATTRYSTACGKVYITVCVDESGYPIEVFARMGKVGLCPSAFLEAVSRTLSVALRCGVDAAELASQYIGISCTGGAWDNGRRVTSCVTAIGLEMVRVLSKLGIGVKGAPNVHESTVHVGGDPLVTPANLGDIGEDEAKRQADALRVKRDEEGLS